MITSFQRSPTGEHVILRIYDENSSFFLEMF